MSAVRGSFAGAREVRSERLASSPSALARARSFVVATLHGWQVEPNAVDDLELVVSELVTNAFLHGHADAVEVVLADSGPVVRLAVRHHEPVAAVDAPDLAPLTVSPQQTHGRGLAIVDVLASAWGVQHEDTERQVWADLVATRRGLVPADERPAALTALQTALDVAVTVRAVGDAVTGWARDRLATSFAGIALPDGGPRPGPAAAEQGHLQYLSVEPLPPDSAAAWARFPVDTDAPVAAAFREGRAFFHESRNAAVAGFPGLGPALAASEMAALAHLPLLAAGHPVGTFALAWVHGRELDAEDREWLGRVAATAAAALVRVDALARDETGTP